MSDRFQVEEVLPAAAADADDALEFVDPGGAGGGLPGRRLRGDGAHGPPRRDRSRGRRTAWRWSSRPRSPTCRRRCCATATGTRASRSTFTPAVRAGQRVTLLLGHAEYEPEDVVRAGDEPRLRGGGRARGDVPRAAARRRHREPDRRPHRDAADLPGPEGDDRMNAPALPDWTDGEPQAGRGRVRAAAARSSATATRPRRRPRWRGGGRCMPAPAAIDGAGGALRPERVRARPAAAGGGRGDGRAPRRALRRRPARQGARPSGWRWRRCPTRTGARWRRSSRCAAGGWSRSTRRRA